MSARIDPASPLGVLPGTGREPIPSLRSVLELSKPLTWFPPVWAFGCGAISGGFGHSAAVVAGMVLAGPLTCGTGQAINDWYDRHVDAINEPSRPIPSGRIAGHWGLRLACLGSLLSLVVALLLGPLVALSATVGLLLAWAYSAPPIRLKRNGWWSALACGFSYEGLPWFAGAAISLHALPGLPVVAVAVLYSFGAHGIMTLNDFKSINGDRQTGLGTLPARLGPDRACRIACAIMAASQLLVTSFFLARHQWLAAVAIAVLLAVQVVLMRRLLADPAGRAPWYNGTGTGLFVLGMLVAAFALEK